MYMIWLNGLGTNQTDSYAKPMKYVQYIFCSGGKFCAVRDFCLQPFVMCSCYSLDKGGVVH